MDFVCSYLHFNGGAIRPRDFLFIYDQFLFYVADYSHRYNTEQKHPRGSIVEPQGLHQDCPNSLSYNVLKTPIIIADVYDLF